MPTSLRTAEALRFITTALPGGARVLEVGCGRGQLARALALRGFAVTALDLELRDVVEAPGVTYVERDLLAYDAPPFDAVLFTASLHHIAPLADAIARAHALLVPGGRLIADEFDVAAPDAATLRWFYDVQELLVAGGHVPADAVHEPHPDVVERWRHAHHHDERLHTGAEMLSAIGDRLRILDTCRLEYLYWYIADHLTDDALATTVLAIERRMIAGGHARPVGLRVIAERPR